MARRVSLPGADELFRATGESLPQHTPIDPTPIGPTPIRAAPPGPAPEEPAGQPAPTSVREGQPVRGRRAASGGPSGRQRHEEKITVYCSAAELLALEQARLALRADHGLAVDRGRIVREAVSVVLADLESKGEASILVRRLRGR